MTYWIKRGGRMFGGVVFFGVLISLLAGARTIDNALLLRALSIALASGIGSWFVGFIISDIVLKGILADFDGENEAMENLLEGGILQRFQMMKEEFVPGGEEMPFVNVIKADEGK